MPKLDRAWLRVAIAAAALESVFPSAASAQTWSPPQFVTSEQALSLATNGSGKAVMLLLPSGQYVGLQAIVQTNGSWSSPITLSTNATSSKAAVAPNGDAVAVWSGPSGLQAAFFTSGRWGNTETLAISKPPVFGLGYDGKNNATVAWENSTSSSCALDEVTGTAASGFGAPQALNSKCYGFVDLAVNSAGQAIAAQSGPTLEVAPVVGVFRDTNGVWGAPFDIATPYYGRQHARVGLASNGNVVAVWRARTFGEYAVRENGGWSGPAELPQGTGSTYPIVAVDGSGNAVAAYLGKVAYRPVGGPFQTPVALNGLEVVATPGGTFAAATGSAIATRLPGSTTWNQDLATSGGVVAAPGQLVAFVNPQTSLSTASVP
jgi:hypothetical protein